MRRVISGVSQNSGFGENTDRDNDSNIRCIRGRDDELNLRWTEFDHSQCIRVEKSFMELVT